MCIRDRVNRAAESKLSAALKAKATLNHKTVSMEAVSYTHLDVYKRQMHYLFQEGRTVFKYAVSNMSDITATIAEKNGLNKDNIDWVAVRPNPEGK